MLDDFLAHNREVYDELAAEYEKRVPADLLNDLPLVFRFWQNVRRRHPGRVSLVDLGCGHGVNLAMFHALGATTTGVEFAARMADVARRTSPNSAIVENDFLSAELPPRHFHAVFAKAFIHLFPQAACANVMSRVNQITAAGGLLYVATTWSDRSYEGYFPKDDYPGARHRFRRFWSRDDLVALLQCHDFDVSDEWINVERGREKRWLNLIAEKHHDR
jgi:SAM-dependent methyltransferase